VARDLFQIFKAYESNLFLGPVPSLVYNQVMIFIGILLIKMYDIATQRTQQMQEQEAPLPRRVQRVRRA